MARLPASARICAACGNWQSGWDRFVRVLPFLVLLLMLAGALVLAAFQFLAATPGSARFDALFQSASLSVRAESPSAPEVQFPGMILILANSEDRYVFPENRLECALAEPRDGAPAALTFHALQNDGLYQGAAHIPIAPKTDRSVKFIGEAQSREAIGAISSAHYVCKLGYLVDAVRSEREIAVWFLFRGVAPGEP